MGVVASDSIQLASLKTVKDAATTALAQAASATQSAQSAQNSATAAGESAARAQAAADAAQGDIDEMSEYFWHDALGAHILSDTSDVSGVRYRTDLKGAGMTINRLNTDGTETEMSKFTATGVQIGDNRSSHTLLTADQQLFYNKKNTMIGAIGTHYDGLVKTDAEVKIYSIPPGNDDYEVRVPLGGVPLDDTRSYVTIDGENYYQLFYLTVYASSEEKPTSYTNLVGSEIIYHIPICEYTIDLYSAGLSSDPTGTLTVTYSESLPNMLTLRLRKTVTDSYYYHVFGIYMYKGTAPYYRFGMDDSEDDNSYESMGILSEAGGFNTYAPGLYAQAGNKDTVAAGNYQTVFGNRNEIDQSSQYAFIVGNGTRERPETSVMPPVADKRRNAFAVDWAGGVVSGLGNEHGPTFNIDVTDLETEGVVQNLMGHGLKRHQSQGGAGVAFADYMIVGNYNEPHVASSATDRPPIFSIGNGTSDSARSNALTVDGSGNMNLTGKFTPRGGISFPNSGAASQLASPDYFITMDSFGDGGALHYTRTSSIPDAIGLGEVSVHNGSATNVSTATDTTLCNSGSLSAGTYIIKAVVQFAANTSGRRVIFLTKSSTGGNIDRYTLMQSAPSPSNTTYVELTYITTISSTTTYYLRAYQNSGSTLSCLGGIEYVKLHN